MSKKILGLDIGVNSVGFALVRIGNTPEDSEIIKMGVRIVNEDPDFHGNFYSGNPASKNAARRIKRMIRRGYQRYKARSTELKETLMDLNMMPDEDLLTKISSLELYELRAKAVSEKISLQELGRIWIHLNQKRGFKSSRKSATKDEDESQYKQRIRELQGRLGEKTIGEYFYEQLIMNPQYRIRDNVLMRSDYMNEFDKIWIEQKKYYSEILTGGPDKPFLKETLYHEIRNEIIYYQRPLKSQKGSVSECRFEKYHKTAPKSSPLFQEFRIWQQLNNLEIETKSGIITRPCREDKLKIYKELHNPRAINNKGRLSPTSIGKILGYKPREVSINYDEGIEGNKTYLTLYRALEKAGIENLESFLEFNVDEVNVEQPLSKIWHLTYSIEDEDLLVNALCKNYPFSKAQAKIIAENVGYTSDYSSLSSRAIRKIIPYLDNGLTYDKACLKAGYNHSDSGLPDENTLLSSMPVVKPNELRNPVVEQVLNQVVNVVNAIINTYGKPDEIRVELARELKNNAKKRKEIEKSNREHEKENLNIASRLKNEHGFTRVNGMDLFRYRLWEETKHICLYSGRNIPFADVYNGATEIEHILPKSRAFDNSMSNYILSYRNENSSKDQETAFDYMSTKSVEALAQYKETIYSLYEDGKISRTKKDKLLMRGEDIPDNFIERQLKDTQYIASETLYRLKRVFKYVRSTTGSVTSLLRSAWELDHVLKEVNLEKYTQLGQVYDRVIKDKQGNEKTVKDIKDWSKREDHRHHAIDALVIALTNQSIIQRLNSLNADYLTYKELGTSALEFATPIKNLRSITKLHLDSIVISFKKTGTKVLSRKINKIKSKSGKDPQETWVPRGSLHEDTIFAKAKFYEKVPLNIKFDIRLIDQVVSESVGKLLLDRLAENGNNSNMAFSKLDKNPLLFNGVPITEVLVWRYFHTKRIRLSQNLTSAQVDKIFDKGIKEIIRTRIYEKGSIKEAFKDIEAEPVWLNKEKGIKIKSITVSDSGSLSKVRNGYAYTKGNHHSIIYTDDNGNFSEKVVSFWEATENCLQNLASKGSINPLIDTRPNENGWRVYTTLQINDLFMLGKDPSTVDWNNLHEVKEAVKYIFRVQKMSKGDYFFRHIYESTITRSNNFAFRRITTLKKFAEIYKLPVNIIGRILL